MNISDVRSKASNLPFEKGIGTKTRNPLVYPLFLANPQDSGHQSFAQQTVSFSHRAGRDYM